MFETPTYGSFFGCKNTLQGTTVSYPTWGKPENFRLQSAGGESRICDRSQEG